jgi:hypothetical protein
MIFGHLAVSALEHRYVQVPFVPVMAAAVVPDIIDKIMHYGFGQHASGRMWGHTLVGVAVSSLVALALFGKRNAIGWIVGYISHLVCDSGGVVPWFAPLVQYEFPPAMDFITTLWTGLTKPTLILEFGIAIWAILALKPRFIETIRLSAPMPGRHFPAQSDDARGTTCASERS